MEMVENVEMQYNSAARSHGVREGEESDVRWVGVTLRLDRTTT
jgi:hypothetical protein